MKPLGLYIHIPFCEKKCHYCDFLTFTDSDDKIEKYVETLLKEIGMYKSRKSTIDTIYIGGGTPSYLPSELMDKILKKVKETFILTDDCEITIEMNPESVTKEKIETYLKNGINRFSMGVQSFNNEVLRVMGRLHRKDTVIKNIKLMRKLGCKNISIDLMLANPRQSMDILEMDLETALSLDVNHISYYSLILKEKTHFELWINQGKLELWNPEEERKMYHKVVKTLKSKGFNQYEISSFAKPGFESVHNQKYWKLEDYYGIGMGAASNIELIRTTNTKSFEKYFDMIENGHFPIDETEVLSPVIREKEYLILTLRMKNGFEISDINKRFNIDFEKKYSDIISKHLKLDIIKIEDGRVFFTENGIDNGNIFYTDIYELD